MQRQVAPAEVCPQIVLEGGAPGLAQASWPEQVQLGAQAAHRPFWQIC